jgi:hypothetical protein
LWGPRKTGKTTFLRAAFPDSLSFESLQNDLFFEFGKPAFFLSAYSLALLHHHFLPLKNGNHAHTYLESFGSHA